MESEGSVQEGRDLEFLSHSSIYMCIVVCKRLLKALKMLRRIDPGRKRISGVGPVSKSLKYRMDGWKMNCFLSPNQPHKIDTSTPP